ncbi:hypothetical protein [Streptomyces sp. NPDC021622]
MAALLHQQDRTPDQIMKAIRGTAKNPAGLAKLGLGVVDTKAAAAALGKD